MRRRRSLLPHLLLQVTYRRRIFFFLPRAKNELPPSPPLSSGVAGYATTMMMTMRYAHADTHNSTDDSLYTYTPLLVMSLCTTAYVCVCVCVCVCVSEVWC